MALSAPTVIRAAIKDVIDTVANVGTVHDYQRTVAYEGDLFASDLFLYTADTPNSIRGWEVSLASTQRAHIDRGDRAITHSWNIALLWEIRDGSASERAFDAAMELIAEAFHDDDTLGGAVKTCQTENESGLQLVETDVVQFGSTLCHAGLMRLNTRDFVNG